MALKHAKSLVELNGQLASLDRTDPYWLWNAIALVYEALSETHEGLLEDFKDFSEQALVQGLAERALIVSQGEVQIAAGPNDNAVLLDAAQLLRALEQAAAESFHHVKSDRGADLEDAYRTTDGRHFVIQSIAAQPGVDGRPFRRRALLHHRVLPTMIDGFAVRLHRVSPVMGATARQSGEGAGQDLYGAALFPGLSVKVVNLPANRFLVEAVNGAEIAKDLAAHVALSRERGCLAIVWPELTMSEGSVDILQATLAASSIDGHSPFRFLVAGSWHRKIAGEMRNACCVLDSEGRILFEIFKWAKFEFEGKREAIAPGDEIHILIQDECVSVVAICRDFLQDTKEPPYRLLDVDVAIVPSMIKSIDEVKTLQGHAATAQAMRIRFGTRTLVVGQPAVPSEGGTGRLLVFPDNPLGAADGEIVSGSWHPCLLESS